MNTEYEPNDMEQRILFHIERQKNILDTAPTGTHEYVYAKEYKESLEMRLVKLVLDEC